MALLTETSLRLELKNKSPDKYIVSSDTKITPSARQFLKDRNIELVIEEKKDKEDKTQGACKREDVPEAKYTLYGTGGYFDKKPEYMTHLYGNKLVMKSHPRIELRGKLDSLESRILELQVLAKEHKMECLVKDLEEVLGFVKRILRAEVLEEELPSVRLLSLNEEELRERSHNPRKYFNTGHLTPDCSMGEIVIGLNSLRSSVREVEVNAVKAFKTEEGVAREDILRALNRLSSCFYIMMLKSVSGGYK